MIFVTIIQTFLQLEEFECERASDKSEASTAFMNGAFHTNLAMTSMDGDHEVQNVHYFMGVVGIMSAILNFTPNKFKKHANLSV